LNDTTLRCYYFTAIWYFDVQKFVGFIPTTTGSKQFIITISGTLNVSKMESFIFKKTLTIKDPLYR